MTYTLSDILVLQHLNILLVTIVPALVGVKNQVGTANVDPESEQKLTAAIEALTKEKTILMIARRLKTVRHADNILVIDCGKIVQSGAHDELMHKSSENN